MYSLNNSKVDAYDILNTKKVYVYLFSTFCEIFVHPTTIVSILFLMITKTVKFQGIFKNLLDLLYFNFNNKYP